MAITLEERSISTYPFGVFHTLLLGLPYAQSPNSKTIYQLNRFPRERVKWDLKPFDDEAFLEVLIAIFVINMV